MTFVSDDRGAGSAPWSPDGAHGPDRMTVAGLATRTTFRLGAAEVDPATRRLQGPGGETALDPRAMLVLLALADEAGRVVTRDALFRRCWGNAIVGDDSLNHAVADVRRAARTTAAGFAVETVPRTGYRLTVAETADPATVETTIVAARPAWSRRGLFVAGGGAAVVAAAATWTLTRPDPNRLRASALVAEARTAMREARPEGDTRAVEALERATAVRPTDAAIWGELALARLQQVEYAEPTLTASLVAGVQTAADRALALDAGQPDAKSALAQLQPQFGDWTAAEARLRAVLADAPGHWPTQDALSFFLTGVGRSREGATLRLNVSPKAPLGVQQQYRLGYCLWLLGRDGDAERTFSRALDLWPRHPAVWFGLYWVLLFGARPERALAMAADARTDGTLPPPLAAALEVAGRAFASGGRAEADRAEAAMLALLPRSPSFSIFAWLVLSGLGRNDRALDAAEAYLLEDGPLVAAVRWRPGQFSLNDQRRRKTHMLFTPPAAGARRLPRFERLVERVGLADYWRRSGGTPTYRERS